MMSIWKTSKTKLLSFSASFWFYCYCYFCTIYFPMNPQKGDKTLFTLMLMTESLMLLTRFKFNQLHQKNWPLWTNVANIKKCHQHRNISPTSKCHQHFQKTLTSKRILIFVFSLYKSVSVFFKDFFRPNTKSICDAWSVKCAKMS